MKNTSRRKSLLSLVNSCFESGNIFEEPSNEYTDKNSTIRADENEEVQNQETIKRGEILNFNPSIHSSREKTSLNFSQQEKGKIITFSKKGPRRKSPHSKTVYSPYSPFSNKNLY
jgi:hypothetical protein